jgi:hypothetical protein
MKKIILVLAIITLIVLGCKNTDNAGYKTKIGLSQYPDLFLENNTFNAKIVVEDDRYTSDDELVIVQKFVEQLQKKYTLKPYTLIQYSDLPGLYTQNTMYIGTCNTVVHNRFVNVFNDCLSLEKDTAIMRFIQQDNITIISVVGKDYKNTQDALSVLLNYNKYNLSGNEVQVKYNENNEIFTRITG